MRPTLLTIVLGCLALPAPAAGFSPKDDKAKLFSADAVEQASTLIYGDKEQYHKELRIRTFAAVPWYKDLNRRLPKMNEAEREDFFTRWARSDARFVDGVYVLICKQPLEVRVVTQFRGRARPITGEEGEKLQEELVALLKEDKNDAALLHAANLFHARLNSVYRDTTVGASFDWATIGSVLLAVVGAWLALYFLHGFSEGPFRAGSAGINPLGLDAGVGVLAGIRAVREGLTHVPRVDVAVPHAPTVVEDGPSQERLAPHSELL